MNLKSSAPIFSTIFYCILSLSLIIPVFAATYLWVDGFERGIIPPWDFLNNTGGGVSSRVTTPIHNGNYAHRASLSSTAGSRCMLYKGIGSYTTCYARIYVLFDTLTATTDTNTIYLALGAAGHYNVRAGVYQMGGGDIRWAIYGEYSAGADKWFQASSAYKPAINTWYCMELYAKLSSTIGEYKLFIDGIEIISETTLDNDDAPITGLNVGGSHSVGALALEENIYTDDVAFNDSYIGIYAVQTSTHINQASIVIASLLTIACIIVVINGFSRTGGINYQAILGILVLAIMLLILAQAISNMGY